jgi:undecaprenyl-diphosphatase
MRTECAEFVYDLRFHQQQESTMAWWEALILGLIQGVTEFFPVSSSGHLVMGAAMFGHQLPSIVFEVAVHLSTIVSVLIVYRQRIGKLLLGMCGRVGGDEHAWPYVYKLLLASMPAALIGVLFKDWFEARFDDPAFAATMVMVSGCVVWSIRWARERARFTLSGFLPIALSAAITLLAGTLIPFLIVMGVMAMILGLARATTLRQWHPQPTWIGALLMGLAQAVAILPGITRSGSTVLAGTWRRLDPVAAAEFSFLMSIIAISGAGLLMVPDAITTGEAIGLGPLMVGCAAALVSGVLAIRFFLAMLRSQSIHVFAYYCWAIGGLFLFLAR